LSFVFYKKNFDKSKIYQKTKKILFPKSSIFYAWFSKEYLGIFVFFLPHLKIMNSGYLINLSVMFGVQGGAPDKPCCVPEICPLGHIFVATGRLAYV
jgi:hypothetical protein